MKKAFMSTLFIAVSLILLIQMSAYPITIVPLIVGGGSEKSAIAVPEIHLLNDGKNVTVKLELLKAPKGWILGTTHVHIANKMGNIPQKNGNPIPGNFGYSEEPNFPNEAKYKIENVWKPGDKICIAAHAEVIIPGDEPIYETGWGSGEDFPGKNWAMYMVYTIQP